MKNEILIKPNIYSSLTFSGHNKNELIKALSLIYEIYDMSIKDKAYEFYIHPDDKSICISFANDRMPKYTSFPSAICSESLANVLWDYIESTFADTHDQSDHQTPFNIVCDKSRKIDPYESFHISPVYV